MSHPTDDPRGTGATAARTRIGFIGLGAMGSRIAGRLLDGGHPVSATNRTAAKARPLIERGLVWLDTPRDVAASTDVVLSMVTDDEALEAITSGPDGLLAGLEARQVYVDMSTVSPQASRRLADRVGALGAHMLDAPVSGSIPQAESGTLAIMVGGERERSPRSSRCCASSAGRSRMSARTARVWCSSSRSTSASPYRRSPSARACCSPNAPASTRDVAADVMSTSSIGSPMLKARTPLLLHLPTTHGSTSS